MRYSSLAYALLSLGSFFLLNGCGSALPHTSLTPTPAATFSGRVHGGEQPVSGATIQLYTVGTNGDGSASTPLIAGIVHTDANGNFSITGTYTCTAATDVYILATRGNPGLGAPNPNLALMTALGPCTNLTPDTYIAVNELTTVAAVFSLSPYMSSATQIGSSASDATALHAAFILSGQLVSPSTGTIPTTSTNSAVTTQINTLADILAACINTTGGTAGDTSVCGRLFAVTTPPTATPPTNTVNALLNVAQNPTLNVAQLYALAPAVAPYQPTLPAPPPDLAVSQTPSANAASGLQVGPGTLTFPSTGVGITSPLQTVVIFNPTTAPVALNGITFTGTNTADFSQTNTCGSTLAPAAFCTVAIAFTPRGNAVRSGSLSVASATPDSPQLVALAGSGTTIVPNGPHAVVDNPVVRIYPGASYDVNLSNTGNSALAISSIALENTPFNTQANNCPTSLDSGASCTISVHSIATGADQLTILTNDASFSPNIPIVQTPDIPFYETHGAPTAVFTPSDVFFAGTEIGSTSHFTYTYNAAATITPSISGPQASDFTATAPACGQSVSMYYPQGCTSAITFTPSAAGLRSAKMSLDGSGNYLPLASIGTNGIHSLTPYLPAYFPYYPVPQTVTLSNSGSSSVPSSSISFQTLTGPPEFTQTNNCGATIAPGASCTATIVTTRRTEGGTQALLTLGSGSDLFSLMLDNSVYPVIDFGDTSYSSVPSAPQAFYPVQAPASVYNNGTAGLSENYLAAAPASFAFPGCITIAGTCVGEFTFTPKILGPQTGNTTIRVIGSANTVQQYILLGNGVPTGPAAKLILKQSGFTSLGGSNGYYPSTLTLMNTGPHTITVTGPVLSGSSPQNFTLGQANCLQPAGTNSTFPLMVQGALCTIPITLNSTQTGFTTAIATVTDSSSGLTFSTALYLNTLAAPVLSPSSLNFPGTVIHTVSAPQSVTVTRDITHPVTTSTTGGLIATKGSCAAGETPCILTFVFAPTTTRASPTATVYDGTFSSSTNLPVSGTPLPAVVPSVARVSSTFVNFAAIQAIATTSAPQTVTLTNAGPGVLSLYSISISGENASEFTQTNTCASSLPANASCTISISFSPIVPKYKSAALTINIPTSSGLPLTVPISGVTNVP